MLQRDRAPLRRAHPHELRGRPLLHQVPAGRRRPTSRSSHRRVLLPQARRPELDAEPEPYRPAALHRRPRLRVSRRAPARPRRTAGRLTGCRPSSSTSSAGTSPPRAFANASAAHGETAVKIHQLMARIVRLLEPQLVMSFRVRPLKLVWREILLHSYDDTPWHTDYAVVDKLDTEQRMIRVTYRFVGPVRTRRSSPRDPPAPCTPRPVRCLLRPHMVHERIVWLPSGAIRVELDGRVDVRLPEPEHPRWTLRLEHPRPARPESADQTRKRRPRPGLSDRCCCGVGARRSAPFGDAWVLLDRIRTPTTAPSTCSDTCAQRPEVNAWFVLQVARRLPSVAARRVQAGHSAWLAALEAADAQLPAPGFVTHRRSDRQAPAITGG